MKKLRLYRFLAIYQAFFKLRVGDYRVIYAIAQSQKSLAIHQVGHRREIYD
ncbi:MAG: type II toxin-antitoxin system RelE family toxin [Pseudanabaena sp.]